MGQPRSHPVFKHLPPGRSRFRQACAIVVALSFALSVMLVLLRDKQACCTQVWQLHQHLLCRACGCRETGVASVLMAVVRWGAADMLGDMHVARLG
eukprot:15074481-Alexandrium_andersonii.AAC.1